MRFPMSCPKPGDTTIHAGRMATASGPGHVRPGCTVALALVVVRNTPLPRLARYVLDIWARIRALKTSLTGASRDDAKPSAGRGEGVTGNVPVA